MGESPAQTVREIEEIRDRIDSELDALGEALPPKETLIRRVGLVAVGGTIAVLSLWFLAHRVKVATHDRRLRRLVREAIEEANSGAE
ncbi:MAG: hypothetical protein M3133_01785 [Actinomycetota bacterium]|nr:hypothetical protein [Actinomycetota bacterium]